MDHDSSARNARRAVAVVAAGRYKSENKSKRNGKDFRFALGAEAYRAGSYKPSSNYSENGIRF